MNTTIWLVMLVFVCLVGMLQGCAGPAFTQPSAHPQVMTSDEAIILERAKAYWRARYAQDMQTAFSFEDPVRRKRLSLTEYIRMVREPGKVYAITVKGVTKIEGDQADVEVEMSYRPGMGPWNKAVLTSTMPDDWQKIDGVWYHVVDLHLIRDGKPRVYVDRGTIEYLPASLPIQGRGEATSPDPSGAQGAAKSSGNK